MQPPVDPSAVVHEQAGASVVGPANESDREMVRSLLASAGLPHADLGADSPISLLVARDHGGIIGAIGLERYGSTGLLRSLVVRPEQRGQGLGLRLVRALEDLAHTAGISELVLLTETADAFFARHGYRGIARHEAPAEVQASEEFRSLCPASAVCMTKSLLR